MITQALLDNSLELVRNEAKQFGDPTEFAVTYIKEVTQRLATELGAHELISLLASTLMDCKIGEAVRTGRIPDHVEMSNCICNYTCNHQGDNYSA